MNNSINLQGIHLQNLKGCRRELFSLPTDTWEAERMPVEISVGNMPMMHKKGSKDDRKKCRPLCLLPHVLKVFAICLLHRMIPHIEPLLPDAQAGFRPARGCQDIVCILSWVVDWLLEKERRAVITSLDFKAAIDSVSHTFLHYSLRNYRCPEKYVRLIALKYDTASVTVRIQLRGGARAHSQRITVERGVLQGDMQSPLCFLIALDRIIQRHNPRTACISITDTLHINKLEYAAYVVLIEDNCTKACERL